MSPTSQETTAIILSGGRSVRFGQDKGRAEWRGQSLLQHVLDGLPAERAGTLLVVRSEQANDYEASGLTSLTIVPDDPALPDGPLRGVITGLKACPTEWAWIVGCDYPLVRPELLRALFTAADDRPVIPEWAGRLQPLVGLYPAACGADLEAFAATGEQSLIGALKRADFVKFLEEACRETDPDGRSFLNVNEPRHLDEIEATAKDQP
jgi:molybdopterin-guanine dinucleotide biosynthesis protein A